MENFQQILLRKTWKPPKKAEIYMIIKGKIVNIVQLNDIGKRVEYGKEISLNEYETNRSKDLQNAIKREWVEVVFDRGMMKRALTVQGQQEKIAEYDIIDIAKKMAQSMAEEIIKHSPLVKEIAKEIAKEMVLEIRDNLKIEQVTVNNITDKKIELDCPNNVFVEFKDDELDIKANMQDIGIIKEEKSDLSQALEKMKKMKGKLNDFR
jgi:HD-GYP domain-containing protein (c-di-GMP phosphodiesterase class II)